MTDQPAFPIQQFHDLLLDGTRRSFQHLKRHYRDEHIYRYVLLLSTAYNIVQPGINTEEALSLEVERISSALAARNRAVASEDVRKALRYSVPESAYRVQLPDYETLAIANELLAGFGDEYMQALGSSEEITVDEHGIPTVHTPYDDLIDRVDETLRDVLLVLDREGVFGKGEARDQVVLDLHWFEGNIPQAYFYAMGYEVQPSQPPLNPPGVQTRYEKELVEKETITQALFGG